MVSSMGTPALTSSPMVWRPREMYSARSIREKIGTRSVTPSNHARP